jgi:hypothetical protein
MHCWRHATQSLSVEEEPRNCDGQYEPEAEREKSPFANCIISAYGRMSSSWLPTCVYSYTESTDCVV